MGVSWVTGLAASGLGHGRHAEHDDASLGNAVELGEFLVGGRAADGESFDLAEPALAFGFGNAGGEVVTDLDQPATLDRVRAQRGASVEGPGTRRLS
jgi:hypothetical protein